MEYRIEYAGGRCCNFAYSRKDLIDWLKLLKNESISDIIKLYKGGASKSVVETYKKYIKQEVDNEKACKIGRKDQHEKERYQQAL